MKNILLMTAVFFGLTALAHAENTLPTFDKAWARETVGNGTTSAIYGALVNESTQATALVKAETPVAMMTEIHRTYIDDNGAMQMREVSGVNLEAQSHVILKPGDLHIMLMGLKQKLVPGLEIPLTLHFQDGQKRVMRVPVKPMRYTPGY